MLVRALHACVRVRQVYVRVYVHSRMPLPMLYLRTTTAGYHPNTRTGPAPGTPRRHAPGGRQGAGARHAFFTNLQSHFVNQQRTKQPTRLHATTWALTAAMPHRVTLTLTLSGSVPRIWVLVDLFRIRVIFDKMGTCIQNNPYPLPGTP